jgi:hypothetical protein
MQVTALPFPVFREKNQILTNSTVLIKKAPSTLTLKNEVIEKIN